jgi:hypothetical protein
MRRSFYDLTEQRVDLFEDAARMGIENEQTRRRVTYRSKGARTFVASSGTATSTDKDVGVWATRIDIDQQTKEMHQKGENIYYIVGRELTGRGITPKVDDFIVDGSYELEIIAVTPSVKNIWFTFVVKGR